jgi:hypothetical protein
MNESFKESVAGKLRTLAMDSQPDPMAIAGMAQRSDRFKRMKAEFIERTGIPLDEINNICLGSEDGEDDATDPFEFKLEWLGPYAPVICIVAGAEGETDHITLAKAIQSKRECPAYHINYAAKPTNQKATYGRQILSWLKASSRHIPDTGVILAVTAKEAFIRGVHNSEYLNVPKPLMYYSNCTLIPCGMGRMFLTFNVAKSRLHRWGFRGRVLKTELFKAAECGVVDDFDFQQFE